MPGPPSGSYLRSRRHGERLAAILLRQAQQAAVARMQAVEPLDHKRAPAANSRISVRAVGSPKAAVRRMQRCSFSMLCERSIPFGSRPISGLRMCVVAVAPWGTCH